VDRPLRRRSSPMPPDRTEDERLIILGSWVRAPPAPHTNPQVATRTAPRTGPATMLQRPGDDADARQTRLGTERLAASPSPSWP
jgi:hypothetical protein